MTVDVFVLAFVVVYLSICLGVFLKLCHYGVGRNKFIYSLLSPIVLNVIATYIAWEYVKFKEKTCKVSYSKTEKLLLMLELIKLNIQWFPALVGFLAVAIVKSEKAKKTTKQIRNEKRYKEFSEKSYELYDDSMSYAI